MTNLNQYTALFIQSVMRLDTGTLERNIWSEISACQLVFVPEAEQRLQPKGRYISDDTAIFGAYNIVMRTSTAYTFELFMEEREAHHSLLHVANIAQEAAAQSHNYSVKNNVKDEGDECMPLPEAINKDGDISFLNVAIKEGLPGLDGMLKQILGPILEPVIGIVGGVVGAGVGKQLKSMLGQELDAKLDELITSRMCSVVAPRISNTIINPTATSLSLTMTTVRI